MKDIINATIGSGGKRSMFPVAYEGRMYTYQPEAARICLFFFAYQIKNTYDTIVWNDGPEFIAHHILTLGTCWTPMVVGGAHGKKISRRCCHQCCHQSLLWFVFGFRVFLKLIQDLRYFPSHHQHMLLFILVYQKFRLEFFVFSQTSMISTEYQA
jgi:hypothetical protein